VGYGFDAVGNRLSRSSTLAAVPASASSFDANDRLASDSYDADGNMIGTDDFDAFGILISKTGSTPNLYTLPRRAV
jgi:hypothetical protein